MEQQQAHLKNGRRIVLHNIGSTDSNAQPVVHVLRCYLHVRFMAVDSTKQCPGWTEHSRKGSEQSTESWKCASKSTRAARPCTKVVSVKAR